tara:strand:- start:7476 stop:7913 length:438 start_codon:yes stop_codon:yes gene_type:complete
MSDELTLVSLSWRKRRRNHRLLFGTPCREVRLDWRRHLAVFEPGEIFAYERWEAGKYGTIHWSVHVLLASVSRSEISALQGVRPGAIILLSRSGKADCKALLGTFDVLRKRTNLTDIHANDWRQIGNRLAAGLDVKATLERMAER